jgi:hypothetical protein
MADTQDRTEQQPTEPPDFVPDPRPNAVATPEGDNEQLPDQPLTGNMPTPERPRGDEPHSTMPLRKALD